MSATNHDITAVLNEWNAGDPLAVERLFPLVYDELKHQARRRLQGERPDHTLQPTALVNEAYLKLVDQTRVAWNNRIHFFAIAATIMRQILVDHARARATDKRGGAAARLSIDDLQIPLEQRAADLIALDDALEQLAKIDPRKSKIVEMRFFGGLTDDEIAEVVGITSRTVGREWKAARLWLYRELSNQERIE